jgi:hypothetical protein
MKDNYNFFGLAVSITLSIMFLLIIFTNNLYSNNKSEGQIKATILFIDMMEMKSNFNSLVYKENHNEINKINSDNISQVSDSDGLITFDFELIEEDICEHFFSTLQDYQQNSKKLENLIVRTNSNETVYTFTNIDSDFSTICEDNQFTFQF